MKVIRHSLLAHIRLTKVIQQRNTGSSPRTKESLINLAGLGCIFQSMRVEILHLANRRYYKSFDILHNYPVARFVVSSGKAGKIKRKIEIRIERCRSLYVHSFSYNYRMTKPAYFRNAKI